MTPEASEPESNIRIVKTASCPSMSGKSKLTYHIGCAPDSEIRFRIFANSAAGGFNQDWISLTAIRLALSAAEDQKAITAFLLHPLYQGKSVNTPSFLLAALKNEGLVQPSTTTRRCHEWVDETKFIAGVRALAASGKQSKSEAGSTKSGGKQARDKQEPRRTKAKASKAPKTKPSKPRKDGGDEIKQSAEVVPLRARPPL